MVERANVLRVNDQVLFAGDHTPSTTAAGPPRCASWCGAPGLIVGYQTASACPRSRWRIPTGYGG